MRRDDPEWREAVWERWQRRRDLPYRQLAAAREALVAELIRDRSWAWFLGGVWVGFLVIGVLHLLGVQLFR